MPNKEHKLAKGIKQAYAKRQAIRHKKLQQAHKYTQRIIENNNTFEREKPRISSQHNYYV